MSDFLPPEIGSTPEPTAPPDDSLANSFLKNIPEVDRAVVEKYVKDWDAGVTKRFQSIHEQYKPYKELGDPDLLQKASYLYQLMDENPEAVYQLLHEQFGQTETPPPSNTPPPPEFEGLPQPFVDRFSKVETTLEKMAKFMEDQQTAQQHNAEDQQLEKALAELRKKYGDFDEDWVLAKTWRGMPLEKAAEAYQAFTQGIVDSHRNQRPTPPILGGNGSVPSGGVKPGEMTSGDVKSLVAKMLAAQES